MPPPPLSSSTIVSFSPSRARGEQAADVVRERDVADQQHDRARRSAAAAPNALETVPSMPLAPRLQSTRGGSSRTGQNVSMSRTGIEEATNSVASLGQQHAELGRDRGLGQVVRRRARRRIASAARSSALRQRASQSSSRSRRARRSRVPSAASSPAPSRARARATRRAPTPGPARRPRGRARPGGTSLQAREPVAQRL